MVELNDRQIQLRFINGHVNAKPEINSIQPFNNVDQPTGNISRLEENSENRQMVVDFNIDRQDPLE